MIALDSKIILLLSCSTLFYALMVLIVSFSVVMMSPSPSAAVCRVGDQLVVMCSTNDSVLDWEFVFAGTNDRIDSTVTSTQQVQDVHTSHSTVFLFSRTSERGALPLVSTLEIGSVGQNLNGSTISCMESSSVIVHVAMTTIYIIGESDAFLPDIDPPNIVSIEEQFRTDSVSVLLQWPRELNNSLISYLVSVVPMVEVMITTGHGSNRANVTVPYNSPQTIRVVADFCGRINASTIIEVHYANCGDPLKQRSDHKDSESVIALGYSNPALEGSSVDLKCPPRLTLIGPNVSTCMGNGEWEPNLGEVECQATSLINCGQPPSPPTNGHIIPYTNTLEGAIVTYVCWNIHQEANTLLCTEVNMTAVCNEHGKWEPDAQDLCSIFSGRSDEVLTQDGKIAVASSVTIFTVASILFFTIGFLCGHFCQKKRKQSTCTAAAEIVPPSGGQTQIPYYDDVVLKQEVELKENVAYAPIR